MLKPSILFHPQVKRWFSQALGKPTEIQKQAWPQIKRKQHTLIAAPTGSGKTLAAFFAIIDDLVQQGLAGRLSQETQVVYVSPLKALSNDIHHNLQIPLKGIREQFEREGLPEIDIEVFVRTGDTTPSQRAAMIRKPPHILVTTPESLYLLLTSQNGRRILSNVHTLIVDEIHALVGNKRGSHLALSMERLQNLCQQPLTRIGLSATQKPIEQVASFLRGSAKQKCKIIDSGHHRPSELSIEVPPSPLEAVTSAEVWQEIYQRLEQLILSHQTTLIFVNTRRLAERMAHQLTTSLGQVQITAHHGSMSKEQRHEAEQNLKSGNLRALVATASMELGIDIGSVDLVCQIGSPKSIAAFLQRVGRSGHSISGTPKGKLFPLTPDELVEGAALLDAIKRGQLDAIEMPEKPLDVLAQQMVAELADREYSHDELYQMVSGAYPYRNLSENEFGQIVDMLAEGYASRRGRRGAYIYQDLINKKLAGRKGARITALVSGGAIPDNFDVDVIMEPASIFVGSLNEDFALESLPGDIIQLGNNSYRVLRVESGKMRVEDAHGQPPNIPFWLGEAPGRTWELSEAVSHLREQLSEKLGDLSGLDEPGPLQINTDQLDQMPLWKQASFQWLVEEIGVVPAGAHQIVDYLAATKAALGALPSHRTLVLERFFDQMGDQHVVIHAPFGSRLNRAWGLSLRKRFCRKFNFELQAAATEEALILSLGPTHSFPLEEVFSYLKAESVRGILVQALLDAPMFEVHWRWNASIALAVLRRRAGKKVPPQLQRMQAEDLVAQVFPDQLACLENIAGDREVPDHPLIQQTISDCLHEVMDINRLEELLTDIASGKMQLLTADLREPSPLSYEILNARPYAFLDEAPFEERRTQAVRTRRWMDPKEAKDLGKLNPEAITLVKKEAWPQAETPNELHDTLLLSGFITENEGHKENWQPLFDQLLEQGRVTSIETGQMDLWIAVERVPMFQAAFEIAHFDPMVAVPEKLLEKTWSPEEALVEIIRNRLEIVGPTNLIDLSKSLGLSEHPVNLALLTLENQGFVFQGRFTETAQSVEWCERRLLARIHRYTIQKLRKEIQPVSPADYMRFLFEWQHVTSESQLQGPDSLMEVLRQMEGYQIGAAAWESDILPSRLKDYDYLWLDVLCLSGKVKWNRLWQQNNSQETTEKSPSPIKTTPIGFTDRAHQSLWNRLGQQINQDALTHSAKLVLEFLNRRGASFFDEIIEATELLKIEVEEALAELVSGGLITSDSFTGLRALLLPAKHKGQRRNRNIHFKIEEAGRWSLVEKGKAKDEVQLGQSELIQLSYVLLRRYGVVFRKLVDREKIMPPWRDLVKVFRLLEARGEIRGGRFVNGVWGEQFALKEAVAKLRTVKKTPGAGDLVSISAMDPLNLTNIITPGGRVPAFMNNRILYLDGVPIAIKNGKEIQFTQTIDKDKTWQYQNALIRRQISPKLKAYLGKGIF